MKMFSFKIIYNFQIDTSDSHVNAFIVFLILVQSVSVEVYENRDKSRKSTKFGIHVLEGI